MAGRRLRCRLGPRHRPRLPARAGRALAQRVRLFPPDELLTHVTLYWVTNTIGSSFGPYAEREVAAPHGRVPVPAAVSQFPADLLRAPRGYAERFLDVRQWVEHDRGGHFAALEVPDLYAGDLRAFLAGVVDRG